MVSNRTACLRSCGPSQGILESQPAPRRPEAGERWEGTFMNPMHQEDRRHGQATSRRTPITTGEHFTSRTELTLAVSSVKH